MAYMILGLSMWDTSLLLRSFPIYSQQLSIFINIIQLPVLFLPLFALFFEKIRLRKIFKELIIFCSIILFIILRVLLVVLPEFNSSFAFFPFYIFLFICFYFFQGIFIVSVNVDILRNHHDTKNRFIAIGIIQSSTIFGNLLFWLINISLRRFDNPRITSLGYSIANTIAIGLPSVLMLISQYIKIKNRRIGEDSKHVKINDLMREKLEFYKSQKLSHENVLKYNKNLLIIVIFSFLFMFGSIPDNSYSVLLLMTTGNVGTDDIYLIQLWTSILGIITIWGGAIIGNNLRRRFRFAIPLIIVALMVSYFALYGSIINFSEGGIVAVFILLSLIHSFINVLIIELVMRVSTTVDRSSQTFLYQFFLMVPLLWHIFIKPQMLNSIFGILMIPWEVTLWILNVPLMFSAFFLILLSIYLKKYHDYFESGKINSDRIRK